MPKAGLEPACLAAPPPQDGVSANSTTSASKLSRPPVRSPLLFLRSCGRRRRALLLLLLRSRRRGRLGRLTLLGRRLGRRLARRRGRRLHRLGRLILLLRSFADDGTAAGPRNQNRQRERGDHEDDRRGGGRFAQQGAGAAGAECRL